MPANRSRRNTDPQADLPTCPEAERAVIGSLMIDRSVLQSVGEKISSRDFVDQLAANVFSIISRLDANGIDPDTVLLLAELKKLRINQEEAIAFLGACSGQTPHSQSAGYYAEVIRETSQRRSLHLLSDDFSKSVRNGLGTGDILTRFLADADDLQRASAPPEDPFPSMTFAELSQADLSVTYLVEDILAEGQPCLLGALGKAMKTSVAMDLAISLASGGYFLGKFKVAAPKRVLFMNGEGGYTQLKEIGCRVAAKAHQAASQIGNLEVCDRLPNIGDPTNLTAIGRKLAVTAAEVLIIDAAYLCMPGEDAANVGLVGKLLRGLNDICRQNGVTLILLHHFRTTGHEHFRKPNLSLLCGAGYTEFARQWILLARREPYEEGTGHHPLWFVAGGSAGHSCQWGLTIDEGSNSAAEGREWEVTIDPTNEVTPQTNRNSEKRKGENTQRTLDRQVRKTRETMAENDKWSTKTTIRKKAGMNNTTITKALETLAQRGEIIEREEVKDDTKTVCYRINQIGLKTTQLGGRDKF